MILEELFINHVGFMRLTLRSLNLFSDFVPVDICLSKERFQLNALFQGKVKLSVMNFVILRVK